MKFIFKSAFFIFKGVLLLAVFVSFVDVNAATSAPNVKRKKKHYPTLVKRLPFLTSWTDDELNFQHEQCLRSPQKLQEALRFFATDAASGKQQKIPDNRQKNFVLFLVKEQLRSSLNKSFHKPREITAITDALHLITYYRFNDFFYKIIPFVAYPSEQVRLAAYQVLRFLGDDRMLPVLMSLAQSSRAIDRIFGLKAFVALHEKRALPHLLRSLRDPNASVRFFAIEALTNLNFAQAAPQFLKLAKHDSNIDVRVRALQQLREYDTSPAFYSLVLQLLNDKEKRMRLAALQILQRFDNPSALRPLLTRIEHEQNCSVLEQGYKTITALQHQNYKALKGLLFVSLPTNCPSSTLLWQIYVFRRWAQDGQEFYLIPYLNNRSSLVREETLWALLECGYVLDAPTLAKVKGMALSAHESFEVRSVALYLLQRNLSKEEKSGLKKLLQQQKSQNTTALLAILFS